MRYRTTVVFGGHHPIGYMYVAPEVTECVGTPRIRDNGTGEIVNIGTVQYCIHSRMATLWRFIHPLVYRTNLLRSTR